MKNYSLRNLTMFAALFGVLLITSCGDDEESVVAAPEASFTTVIDGKSVAFTNTSTGEEVTYAWEFGDGETSDQMSPTHVYTANGSYVVKLTVTNAGGEDDTQAVLEIINITIDGDFADWADVSAFSNGGGSGSMMKLENLGNNKLYVYFEGSADVTPLMQVMINVDNDTTTGAFIDWLYVNAGEDVLIEGALAAGDDQYGSLYSCEPCDGSVPGGWNWGAVPVTEVITDFVEASALMDVSGGKAFEMAIDLTALGTTVSSDGIGIAVLDVSTETWGPVGAVPALLNADSNPNAHLISYTFK